MHGSDAARARLAALDRAAGDASRDLALAPATIRFDGLSEGAAAILDARWGGFVRPSGAAPADLRVHVVRGSGDAWLPRWTEGERYRIEAAPAAEPPLVRSYHFALGASADGRWRLAVEETPDEPLGRIFDNAARLLVARIALDRGGLALHGAGVRRGGRGYIFAGPSGSGKSTASRASRPSDSLGDDFAIVVRDGAGFATCALPFDNAEAAPADPVRGLVPLALVCRLFQAPAPRLERPPAAIAPASLFACAAFPWALPDLEAPLHDAISAFAASGRFAHLHATKDGGYWPLLEGAA